MVAVSAEAAVVSTKDTNEYRTALIIPSGPWILLVRSGETKPLASVRRGRMKNPSHSVGIRVGDRRLRQWALATPPARCRYTICSQETNTFAKRKLTGPRYVAGERRTKFKTRFCCAERLWDNVWDYFLVVFNSWSQLRKVIVVLVLCACVDISIYYIYIYIFRHTRTHTHKQTLCGSSMEVSDLYNFPIYRKDIVL